MKNINEVNYPNIDDAVAFEIDFVPLIYTYDDRKAIYDDLKAQGKYNVIALKNDESVVIG